MATNFDSLSVYFLVTLMVNNCKKVCFSTRLQNFKKNMAMLNFKVKSS